MQVVLLRVAVFLVCITMCVDFCQAQASTPTPVPQLFYEDTTASQRVITQLAVDNAGNIISFTVQTGLDCGFGICGAVVYSIAPDGSLNWVTPAPNYVAHAVNQIAIASDNSIFFQDQFATQEVMGLTPTGSIAPGWPVALGSDLDTANSTLLIDPIDQSIFAKGGTASAFEPPLTRTASFRQNGTTKWVADFPTGAFNTPGMILGPNGNVYTFTDRTVLLDRSDGHTICAFPVLGGDSFSPITGGDGLVFSYTATQVLRSDSGCIPFSIYKWDTNRHGFLLGYDHGILFAEDIPNNGVPGTPRFIAFSKDGVLLWANDLINPLSVAAVNHGLVYVVGIDTNAICCSQQKLFVLDESNGNILASPEITAICPACVKVAIGPNGVYVADLSSTKIYKINGLLKNTSSEWRMQGVNPSRTNVAPVKGPETAPFFKPLATNVAGNLRRIALDGSLIVVDRIESNSSGSVSSYRIDGTLKWATTLAVGSVGIVDTAVGSDGTVFVSTVDTVTALNGNTGQSIWAFSSNPGSESSSLAVGNDGTIYFHNGGGTIGFFEALTAINPDGSLKWQEFPGFRGYTTSVFNTDQSLAYLINGKTCCGGLPIGNVSSFSTIDGHKINDTPCDPRGDVYAFAQWGALYSGNGNNDLLAFAPDLQSCTIVSADGMVAVGIASTTTTGRIITINNDGTLGGIDQQGNFLWRSTEPLSQAFSSADAVIYAVAPVTNDLVALESEHGAVLWRKHFSDPITGQFIADDGNIYLTAGTNLFVSMPASAIPNIAVLPSTISFGRQLIGTSSTPQIVTLTNVGDVEVQLVSISLPRDFSEQSTCNTTLSPKSSCTISVSFAPHVGGFIQGTMIITDNTPNGSEQVVLTGLSILPPQLSLSSTQLNFNDQPIGFASSTMNVNLANVGGQTLDLSLSITGDFQQSNNCNGSLLPGTSCTASVTFTPTAIGNRTGFLTINDNAQGSPHAVSLAGNGVPAIGRPILFVHGFCGTPDGWSAMEIDLFQRLHQQFPTLYTNPRVFEASTDGSTVDWTDRGKKIVQQLIPGTARFFAIRFSDPRTNDPKKKFDANNVAEVPISVKGNELAQTLQAIRSITQQSDVIVIAHSMGGLVARAYLEGLASPPTSCGKDGTIQFTPGTTQYMSDIAELITLDTPHNGAKSSEWLNLPGACFTRQSTNKLEMNPPEGNGTGGQLIGTLNYLSGFKFNNATATALPQQSRYVAIKSYALASSLTTLLTDDVLSAREQDMADALGNPSSPTIQTIENLFDPFPPDIACHFVIKSFETVRVLHFLECVGTQKQTLDRVWNVTHSSVFGSMAGTSISQPGGTCKQ